MPSFQIDCNIPETPIGDGKIHRFRIGKKNNKNGWYIFYPDGNFGICGDWATGEKIEWKKEGYIFTEKDKEKIVQAIKEQKEKQEQDWIARADDALETISECKNKGTHGYLTKKKINANGALFYGNKLILPLQDVDGKVWSIQDIYENGDKMFLSGGKVRGCYFPIYGDTTDLVVVCEGFATGASIHQATGLTVFCAMNAGNIKTVCEKLPYSDIIIAADNDKSGIGKKKAIETGYKWVMPFNEGEDFSDLWVRGEDIKSYFLLETKEEKKEIKLHGLVGEIADWITSTALRPQPKLSLASALTIVATLKGRKYKTKTNLYSNIYCLTIAESGTGKDHPQKMLKQLCRDLFMSPPASNTGFVDELASLRGHGVLMLDELADWIDVSRSKGMAHKASIFRTWLELFGCSRDNYIGERRADSSKESVKKIEKPLFCLLTASTPEKLQRSMISDDINGGLLNRFLFFMSNERPRKVKYHELNKNALPENVLEKIKGYLAFSNEEAKPLLFERSAYDLYNNFDDYFENQLQTIDDNNLRLLYNRANEYVGKISLILCDDIEIKKRDVECAFEIVKSSIEDSLKFCSGIARNSQEADFLKVRNWIKDNRILTRRELTRKIQGSIDAKRKFEILLALEEIGDIVINKEAKTETYKFIGK